MDLLLGTWNVRSLYETAAAKSLADVLSRCKIQILALQETRWKGNSTLRVGDYTFFNSDDQKHFLGIGFAVHKSLLNSVKDFQPISDRTCSLRIMTKFFNLTLINVHAEAEEKEDLVKDEFYNRLEQGTLKRH